MKLTKLTIIFILLLVFAVSVSAQNEKLKVIWTNVQEKYENFEDIQPTIINQSNHPIYFESDMDIAIHSIYLRLEMFDETYKDWIWNNMICGTESSKERKTRIKNERKIAKLKQKGKYIPPGFKLNPNEKFKMSLTNSQWDTIINGPVGPTYKSGKFRFLLLYWWYNSIKDEGAMIVKSPEFWVKLKEK